MPTQEEDYYVRTGQKKPFLATLSLFHPLSLKEVRANSSMRPLITVLKGGQSSHLARVKEFCLNCRHQRRATCTVFSLGCSAHGGSWRYFVVKYRKAVRRKTPWTCISGERERTLAVINSNRAMTVNREESVCVSCLLFQPPAQKPPTSSHCPPTPVSYEICTRQTEVGLMRGPSSSMTNRYMSSAITYL